MSICRSVCFQESPLPGFAGICPGRLFPTRQVHLHVYALHVAAPERTGRQPPTCLFRHHGAWEGSLNHLADSSLAHKCGRRHSRKLVIGYFAAVPKDLTRPSLAEEYSLPGGGIGRGRRANEPCLCGIVGFRWPPPAPNGARGRGFWGCGGAFCDDSRQTPKLLCLRRTIAFCLKTPSNI